MIRPMTLPDLETVLTWAADEGWNPGLDDAEPFHQADPEGFLIKHVDGRPTAAISVVNHSEDYAFLGLYLCRPEFRGQGHGLDIWRAGLAHAGTRTVGLDGVPAQQQNYARSGFVRAGRTVRYRGRMAPRPDHTLREAQPDDIRRLAEAEAWATGTRRDRFLGEWFRTTPDRRTLVDPAHDAYATIRRCREGWKIGPLAGPSTEVAVALMEALLPDEAPVSIDLPEESSSLAAVLSAAGFESVFETARMYLGEPPVQAPPSCYAVATLELG
jgi:hypothetical protein